MRKLMELFFNLGLIKKETYISFSKKYYRLKGISFAFIYNLLGYMRTKRYFKQHTSNHQLVVYTCLTDGYDALIIPGYINPNCDYFCFTNDPKLLAKEYFGPWKILPLQFTKLDGTYNNRWHKMHPHILFPNYKTSLYIDSNINTKTKKIFDYINVIPEDVIITTSRHHRRDCIYDEAEIIIEDKKDKKEKVLALLKKYEEEGFPKHFGMGENNLIFRRHTEENCIKLMTDWWDIYTKYSKRDQLSLFYLIWKNNIKYTFFSTTPLKKDHKNIRINKHIKL